jgi:hypothetical protein
MSWKTTSAEPSPVGSEPSTTTATAGLAAVELDVGKPVSGASGPVDPSALALELGLELGLAVGLVVTGLGEPPPLLQAATASPAAAATVAIALRCRCDGRPCGIGQLS